MPHRVSESTQSFAIHQHRRIASHTAKTRPAERQARPECQAQRLYSQIQLFGALPGGPMDAFDPRLESSRAEKQLGDSVRKLEFDWLSEAPLHKLEHKREFDSIVHVNTRGSRHIAHVQATIAGGLAPGKLLLVRGNSLGPDGSVPLQTGSQLFGLVSVAAHVQ